MMKDIAGTEEFKGFLTIMNSSLRKAQTYTKGKTVVVVACCGKGTHRCEAGRAIATVALQVLGGNVTISRILGGRPCMFPHGGGW